MADAGSVALVFPGQGSQKPAMAAPWREHDAFARWTEADDVLGRDVTRLGLEADAAAVHTGAGEWPALLREQVVSPVRWRETVGTLASLGVDTVTELGASPVLTALVRRTDRSLDRHTVTTPEDLPS